jgi:hypothetical protein
MSTKRLPLIHFSPWHVWKYLWRTKQYVGVFRTPKDVAPQTNLPRTDLNEHLRCGC